jgi:hypothetical protein
MERGQRLSGGSVGQGQPGEQVGVPLPVLVHSHPKGQVPPGPLEEGIIELEQDGIILHALAGIVRADGTIADLPEDRIEWASRLSYRHLQREGCLEAYGIPVIPAYENEEPA